MTLSGRISVVIAAALLAASVASAEARKVKKADLPDEVRKTAERESQGARVVAYWQDDDDGTSIYEVDLKVNGHDKGVLIGPDGDVLAVQEDVAWDDLDPAVQEGIRNLADGGRIGKAHSVSQGGSVVGYGADVERDGQTIHVQVGPDGQPATAPPARRRAPRARFPSRRSSGHSVRLRHISHSYCIGAICDRDRRRGGPCGRPSKATAAAADAVS
jgi:hypothetical protein